MSLFGNYEKTGAGIAKNAPKKKPFFRYWELAFGNFWKIIEINMLMAAAFLPLLLAIVVIYYFIQDYTNTAMLIAAGFVILFAVWFGPVIAGCTKILRNFSLEKPTFLMDEFFRTFRSCFRQACPMGIIDLVMAASVGSSSYVYPKIIAQLREQGSGGETFYYVLFILTLSIAIVVTLMSFYAYLMIVSTDLSMKYILKNSLALSFIALKKNFITLLITILVMGGFGLLTFLFPYIMALFWIFIPTGFVAFMIVFNCYPVIQKYVINPYYAQRGETSPEQNFADNQGENLFEDMCGKETPVEAPASKSEKNQKEPSGKPKKKGKVIS